MTPKLGKLRKLAAFLRKLKPEAFDFQMLVRHFDEEKQCGTVCCAIGWCPVVFPDEITWDDITDRLDDSYADISSHLFGLDRKASKILFAPSIPGIPGIPGCRLIEEIQWPDGTSTKFHLLSAHVHPKIVANRIERFCDTWARKAADKIVI